MDSIDWGVPQNDSLNTVCSTNNEGFARILAVYARPGQTIAYPTYGNGTFWRDVDKSLYKLWLSDLKRDGIDLRALPYESDSVDLVVCDPPYRYTPAANKRH